jgi:hypothetical protein
VVFVPNDENTIDEQMYVSNVAGDTLTVTRGYNGTTAYAHPSLSKVFTQAQLAAGQGWLGAPIGPAMQLAPAGINEIANGNFASGTSGWALSNLGSGVIGLSADGTTAPPGSSASAKLAITTPVAGGGYFLENQNLFGLAPGQPFTLTFWAKDLNLLPIGVAVVLDAAPWTTYVQYSGIWLTPQWSMYSVTFTAPSSFSPASNQFATQVQFYLPGFLDTVWIGNVQFCQGDLNLWRRDFTNGVALCNATGIGQTVKLGGSGHTLIAGSQAPSVNTGGAVSSVTIPSMDGLIVCGSPARARVGRFRRGV